MHNSSFAAVVALSGAVVLAHPILVIAAPPEPIKEKIAVLNKSYSETEKYADEMNEFLETVAKNPSGWVFRTGKEIEIPMTKELAAILLNGAGLPPPPILLGQKCTFSESCVCLKSGVMICYAQ